jgi:hypothetical protein
MYQEFSSSDHGTNLIRENHEAPVGLSSQRTTDALGRVSNCIKAQEFGLAYPISISKVLQSRLQNSALRVLVWDAGMKQLVITTLQPPVAQKTYPNMITARP